ncbi:doxx family protein [Croceitalea rosinachiae]|uniref:Doxx family protein n=1 Tax=Croceitalea rosinachiae TaxID=3075596 RepID=A0ABU3A6G5_9FLAO|nr:doxx family protein [Croceitalea sp. F388]MDT0605767.1 doxx family protein [Croceitalea sp. F388]
MKNKICNSMILCVTIGLVYVWFGALKFFPGLSPAEQLSKNTIDQLTFGVVTDKLSIMLLAILEVGIGLLLIFDLYRKQVVLIALAHMACTFSPLLFFPAQSFELAPVVPTLLGQYIGKNIIIVGALVILLREDRKKMNYK